MMKNKHHDKHVGRVEHTNKLAEHSHIEHINVHKSKYFSLKNWFFKRMILPDTISCPCNDWEYLTAQL